MRPVLLVIVVSQFLCTSLWFAGNAVLPDLITSHVVAPGLLAHLTSAVQFGFISGTFLFALLAIADRFSPSRVFFVSAMVAAACNALMCLDGAGVAGLLVFRFGTGFFLAGIYPVGMKIASDYFEKGLGRSLGFLVGALVLGTAFPHLLKSVTANFAWKTVVLTTSVLSVLGGAAILMLVPDGPFRKAGQHLQLSAFFSGFRNRHFRAAAFGYFGHMWELYAFWAFVPVMLAAYKQTFTGAYLNVSLLSFVIIATGGIACMVSGVLSERFGTKKVAAWALALSGACCLVSPIFLFSPSIIIVMAFLIFWGWVVVADSPLFSTLVAQNAPQQTRGTSLTIVNCIGFSITIISVQFINMLKTSIGPQFLYTILAIGPIVGLVAMFNDRKVE